MLTKRITGLYKYFIRQQINTMCTMCTKTLNKTPSFTLWSLLRGFYFSGVAVVAPVIFVGNAYNGYQMAHYDCEGHLIFGGFLFGGLKASYSLGSWGFIGYTIYRHVNRHELAANSPHPDKLIGHYMMHLIPDALGKLSDSDSSRHKGLNAFFIMRGIKK